MLRGTLLARAKTIAIWPVRHRLAGSLALLSAVAAGCLGLSAPAAAITTLSQGYHTADSVALGSIVSLTDTSSDRVAAANVDNANGIIGVVIGADSSLLSLTSGGDNQVQVATSGVVQVLVSDINGDIKNGDAITASQVKGVGMKATSNAKVIGIAQADLSGAHGSKETYTDKQHQKHDIVLGEVPVLVNVAYYYKQPEKTLIPSAVQNIANALAGRSVSPLPILISLGIFIITLVVVVSIIYSMIHSSIISVGRNPMSQAAIYRDMLQMSALIVGILSVSVIAIYLILKKF